MLNLQAIKLTVPENSNIVLGQSHFIKTVEDVYEAMVNSAPQVKFGIAFNEASGPCLTRGDGKTVITLGGLPSQPYNVKPKDDRKVNK